MGETKEEKEYGQMTNEEYRVSSPDYGELIIEMVHKIESQSALKSV